MYKFFFPLFSPYKCHGGLKQVTQKGFQFLWRVFRCHCGLHLDCIPQMQFLRSIEEVFPKEKMHQVVHKQNRNCSVANKAYPPPPWILVKADLWSKIKQKKKGSCYKFPLTCDIPFILLLNFESIPPILMQFQKHLPPLQYTPAVSPILSRTELCVCFLLLSAQYQDPKMLKKPGIILA